MLNNEQVEDIIRRLPKQRQIILEDLRLALIDATPLIAATPESRMAIDCVVRELSSRGYILPSPKRKKNFDRRGDPWLPLWIRQPKEKAEEKSEDDDFKCEELYPILGCSLGTSKPLWSMADHWLRHGGRAAPHIPIRERSLEIFGDEKALDKLKKTTPFSDGRISLDIFRCFPVPVPIIHEWCEDAKSRVGIVIENSTTYDTICRWNRLRKRYVFVAWGAGGGFESSWEGLIEFKKHGITECEYFGDIDKNGILIPYRVSEDMAAEGLTLKLSQPLYRLLLSLCPSGLAMKKKNENPLQRLAAEWLERQVGQEDAANIVQLLASNKRIPQEYCTIFSIE